MGDTLRSADYSVLDYFARWLATRSSVAERRVEDKGVGDAGSRKRRGKLCPLFQRNCALFRNWKQQGFLCLIARRFPIPPPQFDLKRSQHLAKLLIRQRPDIGNSGWLRRKSSHGGLLIVKIISDISLRSA